jgi:hypothetical protein
MPQSQAEAQPQHEMEANGKAKPFRTEGGQAANDSLK